ncbi:pentapeptide repeat-containing protein [Methanoculleus sp.]|uniref:pentapeptide repeat-containing protein n=1 Tax=Methanoculleus sp. TaxID=90427 RepID=UPI00261FAB45|nr:pentapeptide repeat-containing protein [Methanoculleus sp.]MDD2788940.1 pentapeptide repeat-containing protein [Methanoculleus sp.]
MVERPEGWNEELYNKLSFEYLIECSKNGKIEEWNLVYKAYLKSEWERLFPEMEYNKKKQMDFLNYDSGFVLPRYEEKDFSASILGSTSFHSAHLEGASFYMAVLEGVNFSWAHLEGAKFFMTFLKGAHFSRAHLEGADFSWASLDGTDFNQAHLKGTDFSSASLNGTSFNGADLQEGRINGVHLEGAEFICTHLEGAQITLAVVNGDTLFFANTIDDKTDFTGTSLSSARIEPELRTKLERNIRELRWEKWYKDNKLWEIPAKVFWKISDYGSSTLSILFTFLFSNVIFTMFYLALRDAGLLDGSILSSGNDLLLAYMQTTLVPFGILGIDLTTLSFFPVFIIFVQVIFGYTILAALVTRMAIMFQNLSP